MLNMKMDNGISKKYLVGRRCGNSHLVDFLGVNGTPCWGCKIWQPSADINLISDLFIWVRHGLANFRQDMSLHLTKHTMYF